jgi:hypothetical protein
MEELKEYLKQEEAFLVSELKARVDPSHSVVNSPYNQYLISQINDIRESLFDLLTMYG